MAVTTPPLYQRVNLGTGWQEALEPELKKPYMEELAEFLRQERAAGVSVYPPPALVFNAFHQAPLESIKVVIMGQDPYHGPGQAHGLSFSVPKGVPTPPSLKNIFQELASDVQIPPPPHGCLLQWAQQGVLLLNATLTVRQGQPKSHYGKGWERFTDAAIRALLDREIVFILWGRSARDKVQNVLSENPKGERLVLACAHPSPLAAHAGFFGCRHFSKANRYLKFRGQGLIDWAIT